MGEKRITRPTWLITPDASIAAAISAASDADMASGFSQKIALPAVAALMQVCRCIAVGVQIQTASIEGSAIISSADSNALAPGHRAASCSAAECDASATE